jgi:putative oxidoreductase
MKFVFLTARILLGLLFAIVGLNGFLMFMPPPPTGIPEHAMQFTTLVMTTHYMWMTAGFQLISGILLLANRFVTFALVVLAAELVNIFTFHITMWPQSLVPLPILALLLWIAAAWPLRARFFTFFSAT